VKKRTKEKVLRPLLRKSKFQLLISLIDFLAGLYKMYRAGSHQISIQQSPE